MTKSSCGNGLQVGMCLACSRTQKFGWPSVERGRSVVGHDLHAVGGSQVMRDLGRSLDFLPSTMGSQLQVWRRSVKFEISLVMKQGEKAPGASSPAEIH